MSLIRPRIAAAPGKSQPGAYLGGLYLPRAIRPEAQEPVQDISLAASHPSLGHLSRDSPYGRRRPPVEALRENSGDDDDESDADRDAFLARSRPITPRSTRFVRADIDDDSPLSSNDESDDHDSAGEMSSDSEWSGVEDGLFSLIPSQDMPLTSLQRRLEAMLGRMQHLTSRLFRGFAAEQAFTVILHSWFLTVYVYCHSSRSRS